MAGNGVFEVNFQCIVCDAKLIQTRPMVARHAVKMISNASGSGAIYPIREKGAVKITEEGETHCPLPRLHFDESSTTRFADCLNNGVGDCTGGVS